jgi:ribosomal protein L36
MARPQKIGLSYFPLDVDVDQDDKIALIETQHGIIGFGVIIKLLMKIYSEGYFYDWTEKEQILFSKRVNVDIKQVNEIIDDCIKWEFFDSNLFEAFKVLTSRGIQKRYFEIVKRRQRVEVINELLLLDNADINSYANIVIVDINKDNANINPQSKVNKTKENKTKEPDTDILLQIKNLRQRYSENNLKTIDSYMDILRWTRKNGKIADSVILKIYQEWAKYSISKVIYALNVYINNPNYHDKKEQYCYGIMRNATAADIENKKSNQQECKSMYPEL